MFVVVKIYFVSGKFKLVGVSLFLIIVESVTHHKRMVLPINLGNLNAQTFESSLLHL
jgi:hypothetical protein